MMARRVALGGEVLEEPGPRDAEAVFGAHADLGLGPGTDKGQSERLELGEPHVLPVVREVGPERSDGALLLLHRKRDAPDLGSLQVLAIVHREIPSGIPVALGRPSLGLYVMANGTRSHLGLVFKSQGGLLSASSVEAGG